MEAPSDSHLAVTRPVSNGDIPVCSLDEAVELTGAHIDLLNLDCDGAERDIPDAENALQHVPIILKDYHLTGGRTLD